MRGALLRARRFAAELPTPNSGLMEPTSPYGHWENTIEGQDGTVGGPYRTKEEAVAAGRAEAKRRSTEHVIHLEDGSIGERNSYGRDPAHRAG